MKRETDPQSSHFSIALKLSFLLLIASTQAFAADPCLSGSGKMIPLPESQLAEIAAENNDDSWMALMEQAEFLGKIGKERSLDYTGFNPDYKAIQSARSQVQSLELSRCAHSAAAGKFLEAEKLDSGRKFDSYSYQKFRDGVVPLYYQGTAGTLAAAAEKWSADQQMYFDLWVAARKGYEAFWIFEKSGELDKYTARTEKVLGELAAIRRRQDCKKLCGDRITTHSGRLERNLKDAKEKSASGQN